MPRGGPHDWMWSEALQMLSQAERLHRQVFKPVASQQRGVKWEPPVDVLETEDALLIFAALPGVDPAKVQAIIHDGTLVIAGERILPEELKTALIHRLELPQGHFERHIQLPPGRYGPVRSVSANGCLVIHLGKIAGRRQMP